MITLSHEITNLGPSEEETYDDQYEDYEDYEEEYDDYDSDNVCSVRTKKNSQVKKKKSR